MKLVMQFVAPSVLFVAVLALSGVKVEAQCDGDPEDLVARDTYSSTSDQGFFSFNMYIDSYSDLIAPPYASFVQLHPSGGTAFIDLDSLNIEPDWINFSSTVCTDPEFDHYAGTVSGNVENCTTGASLNLQVRLHRDVGYYDEVHLINIACGP